MKNVKSIIWSTMLVLAISAPAFAKGGIISTTKTGTISTTRTGTISTTAAGTISTTRTGTISTTRTGIISTTRAASTQFGTSLVLRTSFNGLFALVRNVILKDPRSKCVSMSQRSIQSEVFEHQITSKLQCRQQACRRKGSTYETRVIDSERQLLMPIFILSTHWKVSFSRRIKVAHSVFLRFLDLD